MHRKSWLANGLLVIGSASLALLAVEIGLRVRAHLDNQRLLTGERFSRGVEIPADGHVELGHMIRLAPDPEVVYELKPDLSVRYEGAQVTTDGQGFRTLGSVVPSTPDTRCIVGIGDSFMFGQGVGGSETYLAVLQERLAERRPDRPLHVVNAAVPGYNTVMEVAALQDKGLSCNPEVVIIEFVGNDLSLPNFVRQPKRPWSLRRSFLHDFIAQRLGLRADQSLFRELLDAGLVGVPQDAASELGNTIDPLLVPPQLRDLVGWEAYVGAMRELRDLARRHGFEVVSISLGTESTQLKQRALALSRDLGFHVLDIGAEFRDYVDRNGFASYLESPLALRPDDGHPSALAHYMAGEVLAQFLDESVLGPSPAE